jgi:hypothetical protein
MVKGQRATGEPDNYRDMMQNRAKRCKPGKEINEATEVIRLYPTPTLMVRVIQG